MEFIIEFIFKLLGGIINDEDDVILSAFDWSFDSNETDFWIEEFIILVTYGSASSSDSKRW